MDMQEEEGASNMFTSLAASFQSNRHLSSPEDKTEVPQASGLYSLASNPPKRRVNNIWADVAQEEEIQNTANEFDIVSIVDKFKIIRGPETYIVGDKRKRKSPEESGLSGIPKDKDGSAVDGKKKRENWDIIIDEESGADFESDSSISSGGLSDDCKSDLRKRSARSKKMKVEVNLSSKKKRTSHEIMEGQMSTLEDWQVAHFIGNRLNEKKKKLIQKTMKLLGREETLKLFWKTLKIERRGGLMIKNKSRRRTPGGVFLYLLRNKKTLDQATIREIFKEERQEQKITKKATRLQKDVKYYEHLSKLMKHRYSKDPVKGEKETNTDSEEEELEHSYELPKPNPALVFLPLAKPNCNFSDTAAAKGKETQGNVLTPNANEHAIGSKNKLISYDDDDFLDIHCDEEELF